jgi:disulfide oxidoreductase YuzD
MNDITIQIKTVTEYALAELKKKFPGKEFDLIVRDFAPSIHIKMRETQFSEMLLNTPEGFVFEEFGLDTPSAQGTMHYLNGGRMNYEKTILFLKELRKIPVLEELKHVVGYDHLIPWIRNCEGHEAFFMIIKDKYPQLFSFLDYDTTVKELTNVLMAAIERKYRSDAINYHIRKKVTIESKLEGIIDWQINGSCAWLAKIKDYMPELSSQGFQCVTVTEIVPKGLSSYMGEIGGKTIKVGTYNELNKEFILSQRDAIGKDALRTDPYHLSEIRDLFLHMLIARRYIFPEAIDKILDFQSRTTKQNLDSLKDNEEFRTYIYRSFYIHSRLFMDKLYRTFHFL